MINKLLKKTNIDGIFLTKILMALFALFIVLIVITTYFNIQIYKKIENKIESQKIMVIDNNGNQDFEKVGVINNDILLLFSDIAFSNLYSFSYDNNFALAYSKLYASVDLQKKIQQKYDSLKEKMEIENGYYMITITNPKIVYFDEINNLYKIEFVSNMDYIRADGKVEKDRKNIEIEIVKNNLIKNNYFGLIINKVKQFKIQKKE